ncbi:MAG: ABC-2 family transporter protein [bacterium]
MIKKYAKIYKQLVSCAFSSYLSNRIDSLCYFLGKIVRFMFFLFLIISIFRFTDQMAGYGIYEAILFFLTFNFIDIAAQFLFRGIYVFKRDIISGHFDYILSKPANPLFYIMNKMVDILDLSLLVCIAGALIYNFYLLSDKFSAQSILLYIFFIANGIILIFTIHVIVAALSVKFYESDNIGWVYRESVTIGRMPPEIFSDKVRFIFTYIIPIFIMIAFPVKAFLGIIGWSHFFFSLIFTISLMILSLWFWQNSLRNYSSASS